MIRIPKIINWYYNQGFDSIAFVNTIILCRVQIKITE